MFNSKFPFALSASLLSVFGLGCATPIRAQDTDFGAVAMYVGNMLQNYHYSGKELDDEVSKKLLENYLKFLDFNHLYFLEEDIARFREKYATKLDDLILMKDVSPATEIYRVYRDRVGKRQEKIKAVLQNHPLQFQSANAVEMTREKSPWPKNEAEADTIWQNILEGDLLQEHLSQVYKEKKAAAKAARKAAEKGKETATPAPEAGAAPEKTAPLKADAAKPPALAKTDAAAKDKEPESIKDRVMKRYERFMESLDENDEEDKVNFFLSNLASVYDPHSEYFSQSEMDNFTVQMNKMLSGIGALIGVKDGIAVIEGLVVNGPADKAGQLKMGDKVIGVADGEKGSMEDVRFQKLNKIVEKIRGKTGTTVRLKVIPGDADDPSQTKEISIERNQVQLKDQLANGEIIETNKPGAPGTRQRLGWINLSSFYADMDGGKVSTTVDVKRILERMMKEGIEGLVFDLRGNGGGSLEEAINLTGLFIPRGPVVQAKDKYDKISVRSSDDEAPFYNGPMVVLTDKASASASEIFAASLQDFHRALVVGDKTTFGKGTVQTIMSVARNMPFFDAKKRAGSLKVTIQKFYRIAGGSTQLKGVEADVVLPSLRDVLEIGEDSLDSPLPYDTIPSQKFSLFYQNPFPLEEINKRHVVRIAKEQEFVYLLEDSERLKKRIDENKITLNEKERLSEREENETRKKEREVARKERIAKMSDAEKKAYQVYVLRLDNVAKSELVKKEDVSDEENTGMKMAKNEDEDVDNPVLKDSDFPGGLDPAKVETVRILQDLTELIAGENRTAKSEAKRDAASR